LIIMKSMARWNWVVLFTLFAASTIARSDDSSAAHFKQKVAPILERHCLSCHNEADRKGDFSLETREEFLKGGESGQAIETGKPEESNLVSLITPNNNRAEMPKDADPLSEPDQKVLKEWIAAGARWPEGFRLSPPKVSNTDWWSLNPIVRTVPPTLTSPTDQDWANTFLDTFIAVKQKAEGVERAGTVDRRTLIRRVTFDLIGLPPSPEEVSDFINDTRVDAYDRLIDQLLASPRFGERWARHWLDVVHFGETHGYDKDKPRPNAWPYRDYVIRSFNQDKPYRQFIEEQLAGDVLYPGTVDGVTALGFISAGPWDLIGHEEVPESKIDGKIARHLDRDDMVANTINTFCSMTVHCAQCHNHKFDPISQEDYYRLQAVFAAVDRANKPYDADPAIAHKRKALLTKRTELEASRLAIDKQIHDSAGPKLAEWDQKIREAERQKESIPAEFGYHSQIESSRDVAKSVTIDLGQSVSISRVQFVACHDDFAGIGAGFGFPPRFRIDVSDDPKFESVIHSIIDQTKSDFPNPKLALQDIPVKDISARYVRFTATKLAPRQNDFIFALAELRVFNNDGMNVAKGRPVLAEDSIEAPPRWSTKNLVDDLYPKTSVSPETLVSFRDERSKLLASTVAGELLSKLAATDVQLAATKLSLDSLPPQSVVYAGTVHTGGGAFQGTGHRGGRPRPIFLLPRGDVTKPGPEMSPGAISEIPGMAQHFDLPANHPEGERRAALAEWIVDSGNPLTWRSIVNRIWQYHFGRGLVATSNDFGRMGQTPSHPELLDNLSLEVRDNDLSLKSLHRLLVTSATYQLAADENPKSVEVDKENRFLWRGQRRRLEAEAVRDAILSVSGEMDLSMGGPSFQDFVVERPEHSPHYQYHLADPTDHRLYRRSVYRFLVRSQQQPWMATLDCADPSMLVEKRNETISPLQALALLNNNLMLVMAESFAGRLQRETMSTDQAVERAFELALGRSASEKEKANLSAYANKFGLVNACRLIFNLNEFVFVD
jgi:mono/diheme cytochrome c family protein